MWRESSGPDVIPPGWMTARQWAKREGMAHRSTQRKLLSLVAAGVARSRKYLVFSGSANRRQAIEHYWVNAISPGITQ